jgi:hypothetical protein
MVRRGRTGYLFNDKRISLALNIGGHATYIGSGLYRGFYAAQGIDIEPDGLATTLAVISPLCGAALGIVAAAWGLFGNQKPRDNSPENINRNNEDLASRERVFNSFNKQKFIAGATAGCMAVGTIGGTVEHFTAYGVAYVAGMVAS